MKFNIIPTGKDAQISYRMKCVDVESERVFSEISVIEEQQGLTSCIEKCHCYVTYKKVLPNLVQQTFESPNFMELNIKPIVKKNDDFKNRKFNRISKSESDVTDMNQNNVIQCLNQEKTKKIYPPPLPKQTSQEDMSVLVDKLLLDIYGPAGDKGRSESDSTVSSPRTSIRHSHIQRVRLLLKSTGELQIVLGNLNEHINYVGSLLIRQLRRRDYLLVKRDKYYDVITAHLQALSNKRSEDTRMKFSLTPQPGESGFIQWLDAMKMVAKLQGGIPPEFRKRLWLTLAERHLAERGVDWKQAEKLCFNEWSNPDDDELGIQIVKDLHRTGCSLFCGAAGRDNQAVLRRVLLGFARWNKSVGYCQGLNVLAALVLQVVDRAESSAVKVMIYLVEGVLPEGYFADNLRGLSIDMAVFRDLLRMRLPKLSRHLEALQSDAKDKTSSNFGSSYEPPLTNVFTMQWFLTLFCHCLPQEAVLRVWDLIFLEGDEVLLRTALAIWEGLSDRIMTVTSADEFYSIMGVLTREMLEFTDTNYLIKTIVNMGPLYGVTSLREKHRYNITPWARRLSDDEETDTEEDDRLAVAAATAMINMSQRFKKDRSSSPMGALLPSNNDRDRLALDISSLKQQYVKLRERQRQAHIILSAACARQTMVPSPSSPAMNHLLVGKSALVSGKPKQIGPPHRPPNVSKTKPVTLASRVQNREDRQGVTLHWKDMKKSKEKTEVPNEKRGSVSSDQSLEGMSESAKLSKTNDSDSDSTSTELCDEPDRLSDIDSGDPSSASECSIDKWSPQPGSSPTPAALVLEPDQKAVETTIVPEFQDTYIADITDQIEKLSSGNEFNESAIEIEVIDEKLSENKFGDNSNLVFEKNCQDFTDLHLVNESRLLDNFTYDSKKKVEESDTVDKNQDFSEAYVIEKTFSINADVTLNQQSKIEITEKDNVSSVNLTSSNYYNTSYAIGDIETLSKQSRNEFAEEKNVDFNSLISPNYSTTSCGIGRTETLNIESRIAFEEDNNLISPNYSKTNLHFYTEKEKSPTTPESSKSFSSGETMGPDSKISSITLSPRTPISSEIRDFALEKLSCSSESSESKTLTLRSIDSEEVKTKAKQDQIKTNSVDMSSPWTTMSSDSLQNKSEMSPKLMVSSSSESYSPGKLKSSERSFSSELQSPISANSINYTSNYKGGIDNISESSSIETIAITSPFYPIAHPNQKTPSPYGLSAKSKHVGNNAEISPRNKVDISEDPLKSTMFSQPSNESETISVFSRSDNFYNLEDHKLYIYKPNSELTSEHTIECRKNEETNSEERYQGTRKFVEDIIRDSYTEDDTLSPLPRESRFEFLHRDRDAQKNSDGARLFERSCSSLDKKLAELKSSSSNEELVNNAVKKRSSDILEDIRHLEAKSSNDGTTNTSMLTKKTGYIWEDVKNLEARRQDTFSDSARGFSKDSLERPVVSSSTKIRKTYIVEPKINIDENSDSILMQSLNRRKDSREEDDDDDDEESKLGVWTKVKPRKKGENGRRSSDRALKIIQENSAILQKILTCQAKKRLPDLEMISKEITISPINEEISKIFSPILEKMGLNEHEINEELARINFKDFDPETSTCGSEFDAKINDELSKLSLIDDNEEINHLSLDEIVSQDYLDTREAFIDRQINEELSKLLANCDSELVCENSDIRGIPENVYSYKSPNNDIQVDNVPETIVRANEFLQYPEKVSSYTPSKYTLQHLSTPKSNIDIYRELEMLKQMSTTHVLPSTSSTDIMPSIPYDPSAAYTTDYSPKLDKSFDSMSLKSPYESYKLYDFNSKVSPTVPSNSYTLSPHEKSPIEASYDLTRRKTIPTSLDYSIDLRKPALSKESLEFRVRYDEGDKNSFQSNNENSTSYYNEPVTLTSYSYQRLNSYVPKYDLASSKDYSYAQSSDYLSASSLEHEESDLVSDFLPSKFSGLSETSADSEFSLQKNLLATKLLPGFKDPAKRPVSHPEFPGNASQMKYTDLPTRESSAYRTSSLSLDNIGQKPIALSLDDPSTPSPKTHFSPFPIRNTPRKPKELALKLGLYSPTNSSVGQLKRS